MLPVPPSTLFFKPFSPVSQVNAAQVAINLVVSKFAMLCAIVLGAGAVSTALAQANAPAAPTVAPAAAASPAASAGATEAVLSINDWLLRTHEAETGSAVASRLLQGWRTEVRRFKKVMPRDYKRVLAELEAEVDDHPVSTGGVGFLTTESEGREAAV